jgi:pilus assembly protein Flp/PilA
MLDFLRSVIFAVRTREEGQALVEYALILALVSIAAIGTLTLLGGSVDGALQTVNSAF